MRRVSRRKFLRSAARAGIGAGGLALVGCSSPRTYNERRADGMQPAAVPQAGQALASEPSPEAQAEAVAQSVEAREADEEQSRSAPLGDPETLRQQHDWRQLRDAPGGDGTPRRGGRITLSEPGPWYWSPITPTGAPPVASIGGTNLLPLLYSQLITLRVDDQTDAHRNTIEGDLASQWEIADETTIVFHLRPGVAWPEQAPLEGRELTASDVRHGQERYLDGAAHQRAAYRTVDRIEADDAERSVSFHLTLPTAYLLNAMTAPDHIILPPEAEIDELAGDWTLGSVSSLSSVPPIPGTGPFDHWSSGGPGAPWSMRRKPDYFKRDANPGPSPYVDEIRGGVLPDRAAPYDPALLFAAIMAAWRVGRFDALVLQSRDELELALDYRSDAVFQLAPPMPWRGSEIRTIEGGRNPIRDRRILRALSVAVDREQLAERWHGGFASPDCGMHWPATVDPATGGYREWPWPIAELGDPYQHDPAAARTLLAASGYDSENPLPLVFDTGIPAEETLDLGEDTEADRRSLVTAQWQSAFGDAVRIEARAAIVTVGENSVAAYYAPDGDANLSMQRQLSGFAFPSDPDPTMINLAPAPPDGSEADDVQYGVEDDDELRDLWELQARELDPAERSDILERIRAKRAEHMQPIHLVNVWGILVRRDDVFNLSSTYFAYHPLDYSKQLERTWTLADS